MDGQESTKSIIGGVPRDYFEGPFLDDQTVPVPARYARELAHKLRDAVGLHSLSEQHPVRWTAFVSVSCCHLALG